MSTNGKPHWTKPLTYRCRNCGRRLFDAVLTARCRMEIRCPRCAWLHVWTGMDNVRKPIVCERKRIGRAGNSRVTEVTIVET